MKVISARLYFSTSDIISPRMDVYLVDISIKFVEIWIVIASICIHMHPYARSTIECIVEFSSCWYGNNNRWIIPWLCNSRRLSAQIAFKIISYHSMNGFPSKFFHAMHSNSMQNWRISGHKTIRQKNRRHQCRSGIFKNEINSDSSEKKNPEIQF